MIFHPHNYQVAMHDFAIRRLHYEDELGVGLFADPGLGKTATTLMILETLKEFERINHTLIVAPLRVATGTWPAEIDQWDFDLTYSIVHGTRRQRISALMKPADIYLINPENMDWLARLKIHGLDCLVVDEVTRFKNWTRKRTKALRYMLPKFEKRLVLTGTPAPNCDSELFTPCFIMDDGATLGRTITYFRKRFMHRGGYMNYDWKFNEGMQKNLHDAIAPMVMYLDAQDHLDLPNRIYNKVMVDLPSTVLMKYKKLEEELFYVLDDEEEEVAIALGSGSKYHMCRGAANGGFYQTSELDERQTHQIHQAKTEAAQNIVNELNGKPVLIAYNYDHDLERLKAAWPKAPIMNRNTTASMSKRILDNWNAGKIPVLLVQPQTVEHGLNMQFGGNDIIWYSLTDRPETHTQLNARIWRQGVKGQVRYHYLIARSTIDIAVWNRLQNKARGQRVLLEALKEYRDAV